MTCREKLALEHPDRVSDKYRGGCCGCPSGVGYLEDPPTVWCNSGMCDLCWDREIPETEKKEEKHMTCREKLIREHPDLRAARISDIGCPHNYGYLPISHGCGEGGWEGITCSACWDREIPETEETDIYNNEKENESMPISVSKMTKAQMVEEIKCAHEHIREMEAKLEDLQKYEKYKDAADEIKAIHTALMDSGFTNEQAFDLLKTTMQSMMPTILRGMSL